MFPYKIKIKRILIACIISYLVSGTFIPGNLHDPVDHKAVEQAAQMLDVMPILAFDPTQFLVSRAQKAIEAGKLNYFIEDKSNIEMISKCDAFCRELARLRIALQDTSTLGPKYNPIKAESIRIELEKLVTDFYTSLGKGRAWANFVEHARVFMDIAEPLVRPPYVDSSTWPDLFYKRPNSDPLYRGGSARNVSGVWLDKLANQRIDGSNKTRGQRDLDSLDLGILLGCKRAFMPYKGSDVWLDKFAKSINEHAPDIARANQKFGGKSLDSALLLELVTPPVARVLHHDLDQKLSEVEKPINVGNYTLEEIAERKAQVEELKSKKPEQTQTVLAIPMLLEPFFKKRNTHNLNAENYFTLANTIFRFLSGQEKGIKGIVKILSYATLSEHLDKFRESFNPDNIRILLDAIETKYKAHRSDELKKSIRLCVGLMLGALSGCPFLCLYNINNGINARSVLSKLIRLPYKTDSESDQSLKTLHDTILNKDISFTELLNSPMFKILFEEYNPCNPSAFDTLEKDRIAICETMAKWLEESELGLDADSKEQEVENLKELIKRARSIMPFYEDYAQICVITSKSVFAEEQAAEVAETPAQE